MVWWCSVVSEQRLFANRSHREKFPRRSSLHIFKEEYSLGHTHTNTTHDTHWRAFDVSFRVTQSDNFYIFILWAKRVKLRCTTTTQSTTSESGQWCCGFKQFAIHTTWKNEHDTTSFIQIHNNHNNNNNWENKKYIIWLLLFYATRGKITW